MALRSTWLQNPPPIIHENLHERLLRNLDVLAEKQVTIAGCGALGGFAADILARVGVGSFRLVDRDLVEAHNLGSQLHPRYMLGKTKTQSLSDHLYRSYGARCERLPVELETSNARSLLSSTDLVVCSFDNYKARQITKEICLVTKIPCVFGGVNGDHWYGHVEWAQDFQVPPDPKHYAVDPCNYPLSTSLIYVTSAYLAEAAIHFLLTGAMVNASIPFNEVFNPDRN